DVEVERLRLVGARLRDVGAPVTEVGAEQRGEAVEVAIAVLVPDVAALAAHDDRDLGIRVGAHAREMHPEVTLRQLLERRRLARDGHRPFAPIHVVCACSYNGTPPIDARTTNMAARAATGRCPLRTFGAVAVPTQASARAGAAARTGPGVSAAATITSANA